MWRTERVPIDPAKFEEELEAFVVSLLHLRPALTMADAGVEDRVVTVIVQTDEGHPAANILLSQKTIQTLAGLNAAFDVDNVSVMD